MTGKDTGPSLPLIIRFDLEEFLLICLAILLPWQSFRFAGLNTGLADIIVFISVFLLLFGALKLRYIPSLTREVFGLLIAILLSFIYFLLSANNRGSITTGLVDLTKLFASVAYFGITIVLLQNNVKKRIHLFASWTVVIGLLISIWTTVNALTGEYRVSGPFNNPNLYADYLIFTLFMFCIILDDFPVSNRYTKAFLSIGFLFPITISLFATESRAGLGALFLGILFYVSMNQEFQKKLNLSHIFTLVPGLVFIMYHATRYLSPGTISRFQLVLAGEDTGGRFTRWRSAVEVLVNSPIFGVGWGQHQEYVGSFYELHNTVLQVSVDAGIVGGLLFIAILIRGIRSSIQWSGRPTYVGSAAMGSFLTASISFSIFHNTLNFRTFWIVLAMIGSAELYYYKNHV